MNDQPELDPTLAPSSSFSRRAFVGLTAGAGVLISPAGVLAAPELGKPHEPLVAENDPSIAVEHPQLRDDYHTINAYAAIPKSANATTPGIVVVQAIWGVDAQLRDVVRRLAKQGYAAIAPDLYTGLGAPNGDGANDVAPFRPVQAKLSDAAVDADLAAGAAWLRKRLGAAETARPPKIGVMGFCMGGGIALRQAVDAASTFDAVAIWYGRVRYGSNNNGPVTEFDLAYADEVKLPLVGNFGERDKNILGADVRALRNRLPVPNDIKVYDEAGHAFFDDTRSSYVPTAAADAWTRTVAWFAKYL